MAANLNAFAIILMPIITLIVIRKSERKWGYHKIPLAFIYCLILFLICSIFTNHKCDSGVAFTQWFVPICCIFITIILIEKRSVYYKHLLVFSLSAIILCMHYNDIVHKDGYTGNKKSLTRTNNRKLQVAIDRSLYYIKEQKKENENYPPCFLLDIIKDEYLMNDRPLYVETVFCWHTPITGIYKTKSKPIAYYYPGGVFKDAIKKLEFREIDIKETK